MYKIKFQEHTLYLCDDVCSFSLDTVGKKRAVTYRYSKPKQLEDIIYEIKSYKIKTHIIYHANSHELFDELKKLFLLIEAAGGLIINEKNQILFIYRNNKWDLPKGKIEINETHEHAAIREVEEECAVKISYLKQKLISTYHTYILEKKTVLKTNHWFLMFADSQQTLLPQIEENIEKVEWKNMDEIPTLLKNSYDAIKDVLNAYLAIK